LYANKNSDFEMLGLHFFLFSKNLVYCFPKLGTKVKRDVNDKIAQLMRNGGHDEILLKMNSYNNIKLA